MPERRVLTCPSRLAICLPGAAVIVTPAPSSQLTVHKIDGATLTGPPRQPGRMRARLNSYRRRVIEYRAGGV